MGKEQYELREGLNTMTYEFTSIGPKGEIPKLVVYSKIDHNIYNLAFGDKDINTGGFNDLVITDNKDSQKVLVTVASTVYTFTDKYPDVWIAVSGSTRARTRLYQIGISNNWAKISADFIVLGFKNETWELFEKNIAYDAFLIKRKK